MGPHTVSVGSPVYSSRDAISHSRPDPGGNVNVDARAIGLQDELVQTF